MEWRPENFYEKQIRAQNIASGPRNPVWVKTMVKLALQGENVVADLYLYGADTFLGELVHTALCCDFATKPGQGRRGGIGISTR